jgi:hypothetical protein
MAQIYIRRNTDTHVRQDSDANNDVTGWGVEDQFPHPHPITKFDKAEPNSQFHGKYIHSHGFHSFAN